MLADSIFPNWACTWCVTENQPVTFKDSLSLCSALVSKGISLVFCLPLLPLSKTTWLQWRWPHFSDRKCEQAWNRWKVVVLDAAYWHWWVLMKCLAGLNQERRGQNVPVIWSSLGLQLLLARIYQLFEQLSKKNECYHQRKLVLAGFLQDFATVMGKEPKGKELVCLCWKKTFNSGNSEFSM